MSKKRETYKKLGLLFDLKSAVYSSDLERVTRLLKSGGDLNYRTSTENTYLHMASTVEITRQLLLHGADVNAENFEGERPLHTAIICQKGLGVVRELLAFGANVHSPNYISPLFLAVERRNVQVIVELLNHGADPAPLSYYRRHTAYNLAYSQFEIEAKSTIKCTLLDTIVNGEKLNIDLNTYERHPPLKKYIEDCEKELLELKTYIFEKLVITSLKELSKSSTKRLCSVKDDFPEIKYRFPIYSDTIIQSVGELVERRNLRNDLDTLTLTWRNTDTDKEFSLNSDCMRKIGEYLDNKDLGNLTKSLR